ncbi:MAG: family 78 glycoside hydrolase catalytic domain [Eubacteriales bacterium]|nr:family 78 glycoside hydrolase catalytic domain [Eubacteriales bacterium]
MRITDLRTNQLRDNGNVDAVSPVFSWRIEGDEENIYQKSYRIEVKSHEGNVLWDSGEIASGAMTSLPYAGEALRSDTRYLWSVTCRTDRELRAESFFETGLLQPEDWKGCFIGEQEDHVYHLYRKTFSCGKKVRRARLYLCGLGHFVCWINGETVSDHVLEPGWSNYDKTCFYTAYDVTERLAEENAILVKLGDGMFNVPGGRYVYYERSYGKCKLFAQLEVVYEDGTGETIVSDESWRMAPSPIRFCCIYGGEDYDGRLWNPAYAMPGEREEFAESARRVEPPKGKLRAMPMEPMKVMQTYEPKEWKEIEPGVWRCDFGTNFSGWVRIRVCTDGQSAGHKIVMTPGEILTPEGRVDQRVTGKGYAWTYILNGEREQEFAPDFTYTGFRYVEVRGASPCAGEGEQSGVIEILRFDGEFIYPDLDRGGEFLCSNPLYNSIHGIVLQAILSNTKSYFTDCPHREKLGWLEQTHLIGPSIMYNLQVQALYGKVEQDMEDAQRESGLVPDICPEYVTGFDKWHKGFLDSPEWGSAIILNPWYCYLRYGDLSLARRHYPAMRSYLLYLAGKTHHEMLHHGLGDWLDIGPCTPHSQNTPVPVVATCIYYYDLRVMETLAQLLGQEEDAQEYRERGERVRTEYNAQFLDDQTARYANGSQAAQAMSLITGLVPEEMEERAARVLREDVTKRGYAVTAGDVGHPFLVAALMKYGMSDLLGKMTDITETPGYGYQVMHGATTLTEEWDGPDPAHPHGSQNHLMLGSIEEWFYGGLGGMELVRSRLPMGEIRICPQPVEGVDWVRAWTTHPYGKIKVEWHREADGGIRADVQIPPNVTAHLLRADGSEERCVGSGTYSYLL